MPLENTIPLQYIQAIKEFKHLKPKGYAVVLKFGFYNHQTGNNIIESKYINIIIHLLKQAVDEPYEGEKAFFLNYDHYEQSKV